MDTGRSKGAVMGNTGIVRRVDELGRIVIPMEYRRTLGIHVKDPLSIALEGERVIIQRFQDSCAICGSEKDVTEVKGRVICAECIDAVKKL